MSTNITKPTHIHSKSIIKELNSQKELPFTQVLSQEVVEKHLSEIAHRQRCYTPSIVLFAFLSQAINTDKSCQVYSPLIV